MVNKDYSQELTNEEEKMNGQHDDKILEEENDQETTDAIIDETLENVTENQEGSKEQLEIQKLQQELAEKQDRLLRLQADFENYRRRVRLDQEAQMKFRAQSLIENILPVLDNFERALNLSEETQDEATTQILKGMGMINRQLIEALKTEGLEVIEAVGNEFDPNFHQAVIQVEDDNYDSNIVIEELQKGYKLKDRVIRPTMVKVNQ